MVSLVFLKLYFSSYNFKKDGSNRWVEKENEKGEAGFEKTLKYWWG
jgi:hypothetical protein